MGVLPRLTASAILLSAVLLTDAAPRYERTKGRCYHPIPGVFKLMLGVDITKLDTFTRDGEDGFTQPIFEFSCAETIRLHGKAYQRPNAVYHYMAKDRGTFSTVTEVYNTPKDARHAFAVENGVVGTYGEFGFSDSEGYAKMERAIMKDSKFVSEVSAKDFSTKIRLSSPKYLRLMQHPYNYFKNLKGEYATNPEPYKALVNLYGTHYYSEATLGGLVRTIQKTDALYVFDHNDLDIRTQSVALFGVKTSNFSKQNEDIHADEAYVKNTDSETEVYGGDVKLLTNGGLDNWQGSVNDSPYLLSGKLKPLSDFVKGSVEKDALDDAIRTYIINSYLANLLTQVAQVEVAEYLPALTGKERLDLDNIRKEIHSIVKNDPIEEKDEYFARKVGAIFETILKKHVTVPSPAPSQSSSWKAALDDAIRTQVVKARLSDLLQRIHDMLTEDYLPPITKDEMKVLQHLQDDISAFITNEVFKYDDEKSAIELGHRVHDIAKSHILIGVSGESGTWRDALDQQVHTLIGDQAKVFDAKIEDVTKLIQEYVAPPEPKHSGTWTIAASTTKDKNAKTSANVKVAIYGTKGWTDAMQLNSGKVSAGDVLRGSFTTPDIGRPLKLVMWLSENDGTEFSTVDLANGDSKYRLNVNRWLGDAQIDGQLRMELEFP